LPFVVNSLTPDKLQTSLGEEANAFAGLKQPLPFSVAQSAGDEGDIAVEKADTALAISRSPLFLFRVNGR